MDLTEEREEELEQETDRFVWHDERNYKKFFRRAAVILMIALIAGLLFYFPLRQYRGTVEVSIGLFCAVLVILAMIFRKRLTNNMATFVRCDGVLYRVLGANRGITRIALDNEADAPYFERDFTRAKKGNTCWHILQVKQLKKDRKGYHISCQIRKSRNDKLYDVNFYMEHGYNDMEALLEELNKLKK